MSVLTSRQFFFYFILRYVAKLRTATVGFVRSVRPKGKTRLPRGVILMKFHI
jgi:hypothetical protein